MAEQERPWPTDDELCAKDGHPYYGDQQGCGRCYCGAQQYPEGGPGAEQPRKDERERGGSLT